MQIILNSTKINTQNKSKYNQNIYPYSSLPTVLLQHQAKYVYPIYTYPSFKMKMRELHGIDQFVARKYKINPQPIKTLQEFQKKCKSFVEDIVKKAEDGNFGGRQQETQVQRKAMIKDWYNYVVKENGAYTGAMALMILAGITKELKPDENNLPPVLNKGVLANTVTNIQEELKKDEKAQLNFEKEYRLNLQKGIFREEKALDENLNGWIVIPSKKHDPENFKANVDKLKMLSHDNWCTKSFNAEPYLAEGDFHVYMEQGKPKLGVRFIGDEIQEIQGELNNSRIPLKYEEIAKEYIKDYKLTDIANYELISLEETKAKVKKIQKEFPNGINNYPAEEIFEKLGIECKKDDNGFLTISHYKAMTVNDISFSDLGIDENKLIKNVKRIEGDAEFRYSKIKSLGNLESIGGEASFKYSQITSLGNLKLIGGDAYFRDSKITSLGKLESIGGIANFGHSQITSLGNLESIGRTAKFEHSQITSLGKLQTIGGQAYFDNSKITSLGKLQTIGGWADFSNSPITSLGNLKSIGGKAIFSFSHVTNLGNLKSIGGSADFNYSQIASLGNLESIGGDAIFSYSQITSLGNLELIGKNVYIGSSKLTPENFASVKIGGRIY